MLGAEALLDLFVLCQTKSSKLVKRWDVRFRWFGLLECGLSLLNGALQEIRVDMLEQPVSLIRDTRRMTRTSGKECLLFSSCRALDRRSANEGDAEIVRQGPWPQS